MNTQISWTPGWYSYNPGLTSGNKQLPTVQVHVIIHVYTVETSKEDGRKQYTSLQSTAQATYMCRQGCAEAAREDYSEIRPPIPRMPTIVGFYS